jgi:hypothetical protein
VSLHALAGVEGGDEDDDFEDLFEPVAANDEKVEEPGATIPNGRRFRVSFAAPHASLFARANEPLLLIGRL